MNIRSTKRWQWMIFGLIAGVCVGAIHLMWEGDEALGGTGFITQRVFEQALAAPQVDGHAYVVDIRIRPSHTVDGIDVVSLHAFDQDAATYKEYLLAAPRPFVTQEGVHREYGSVSDYLKQLAATHPAIVPQYAWWEGTPVVLGSFAILGVVVIGGIWPILIGVPRATPRESLLTTNQPADERQSIQQPPSDDQLPDLDEELAQVIEHATPQSDGAVAVQPAVRELSGTLLTPIEIESDTLAKEYAGEFYPVEKHAPHGFSLVELIVVIGIIALLIAFLMPAVRVARMNAQTTKCASQLRQIGQALHAYAADNRQSLPAWSSWHTWPPGLPSDSPGPAWTIELIPYIGKPDSAVYNCPSFPLEAKYRNYFLESQWCGRSNRSAMKLSEITESGKFVLSGDTTNMDHYLADPREDDADPDDFGRGMLLWPWTGGIYMHHGGDNVLFDDGHVLLYSRYDKFEMTFNPHRMEDHDDVTPD